MEAPNGDIVARRRKLWVLTKEIGLCKEERIELTQYLLRRDITSWVGLDDGQVCRLLDALEGYQLVRDLLAMRPEARSLDRDTVQRR